MKKLINLTQEEILEDLYKDSWYRNGLHKKACDFDEAEAIELENTVEDIKESMKLLKPLAERMEKSYQFYDLESFEYGVTNGIDVISDIFNIPITLEIQTFEDDDREWHHFTVDFGDFSIYQLSFDR